MAADSPTGPVAAAGDFDYDEPLPIEQYAIIGDCRTAALVGLRGSIAWLCWPRFDSPACLASLLGKSKHGRWSIAPAEGSWRNSRAYRGDTLILETLFESADGAFAIIDLMPVNQPNSSVIRIVEGRSGAIR